MTSKKKIVKDMEVALTDRIDFDNNEGTATLDVWVKRKGVS